MKKNIYKYLAGNDYPGRGIVLGKSPDGQKAFVAYWIMGRSANSRNRVFEPIDGGIRTVAADPAKLEDPHLIIYNAVLTLRETTVVTNGDQTDTIARFAIDTNDADKFADKLWASLNEDNKVSLFVRSIELETGEYEDIILNKYTAVEG